MDVTRLQPTKYTIKPIEVEHIDLSTLPMHSKRQQNSFDTIANIYGGDYTAQESVAFYQKALMCSKQDLLWMSTPRVSGGGPPLANFPLTPQQV